MKQRLSALLLALTLVFALAACGGRPAPEVTDSAAPEATQPAQTEPLEPSDEPSPALEDSSAPEQTPSGALPSETPPASPAPKPPESTPPAQSPKPSPSPSPSPAPSPSAAPEPSPTPSETPEAAGSVDLAAFYADVLTNYGIEASLSQFTGELLEGYYPGLSAITTKQCLVYGSMMSMSMAEFALVEVSDAADVDAVKAILQGRIDAQVDGGAWYPEPTRVWQDCSAVASNGSYILMVVCDGSYSQIADDFDALFA